MSAPFSRAKADALMRIAIDILSAALGGPGQYIRNFLPHLAARGVDSQWHVLASHHGLIESLPRSHNVVLHRISPAERAGSRLAWQFARMPAWCARHGIDAVFAPQGLTAMTSGPPIVVLHQDSLFFTRAPMGRGPVYTLIQQEMTRRTLQRCAAALFVSRAIHDLAVARDWIAPGEGLIVPYGVDIDALQRDADPDRSARLARERPYVLSVSSVMPHKNFETLVEAIGVLHDRGRREIRLLIAGEAPMDRPCVRDLHAQIARRGLAEQVTLLGAQDRPAVGALYANARLYATLSRLEAYGLTPVEAMGHELPIVCSDLPAFREVCGEAAMIVDGNDPRAAADAIELLWDDPDRRRALGIRGRAWSARFSWTAAADIVYTVLCEAAGGV
jgi:alpha-1,3-rhamnosyl/mannosyltransferase